MNDFKSITAWAEEDRPREKMILKGRSSLTDAELIAILMGSGNKNQSAVDLAREILMSVNNDLNALAKLGIKDLQKFKGVGDAKAISIIAALELGRRRKNTETRKRVKINSSARCYETLKPYMLDLDREQFWIMLADRSNALIKTVQVSSGGVSQTIADVKIIFKEALENLASGIVLAHNHPSGNLKPSHDDIRLTKKIVEAGNIMGISILDHIIFTDDGYYSMVDNGDL